MDSTLAFLVNQAALANGAPRMVFDWDKAARLIRKYGAKDASAGLKSDWEWTGGTILANGRPLARNESYTYLASNWATPQLRVAGKLFKCFKFQKDTPGWDSDTFWPDSALAILNK